MPRRGYLYHLLLLTALGAYVYNVVQESVELNKVADAKRKNLRQRQLMDERLLKVQKSLWPECVDQHMTDLECKDFIDLLIYETFEGKDRYTRTIIEGKRKETDDLYNVITILVNDQDMAVGRLGDGQMFYDFDWYGSGEEATPEQQAQIPPILAKEPDASLADIGMADGSVAIISDSDSATPAPVTPAPISSAPSPTPPVDPAGPVTPAPTIGGLPPGPDPEPPATDDTPITDDTPYDDGTYTYTDDALLDSTAPLEVFDEPITEVTGASTEEYIELTSTTQETATTQAPGAGGTTPAPGFTIEAEGETYTYPIIAGGVLTDHTATNTPGGDEKIIEAVTAPVVIPEAGARTIPPIDCEGMTGEVCCLMIKLSVPDSDQNGKAIQCTINYAEDTEKKVYWKNLRGKKVHIKGNHNGYVSKDPKMSGNWPKGKEGAEFEAWLLEAGAPPLILQNNE